MTSRPVLRTDPWYCFNDISYNIMSFVCLFDYRNAYSVHKETQHYANTRIQYAEIFIGCKNDNF